MNYLNNAKINTIKSTLIDIHPQAIDAYKYFKNSKLQFATDKLPQKTLEIITAINMPIVIKEKKGNIKNNTYNCISGWHWSDINFGSEQFSVIVLSENISKKVIRNISWYYVLSILLQSYDGKYVVAQFNDILDKLPKNIFNQLDNAIDKTTNFEMSRFISNENRSPVRTQIKNFNKINK